MISWNKFTRNYWGSLKVWQPKWARLQYLKHGRVGKSYRVRISYSLRGRHYKNSSLHLGGNWGKHKDNVAVPYCVFFSVIYQKTSLYITTTRTRDISWCPGLTQPRHHNVISVYLDVCNGCPQCITMCGGAHDIRHRWVAFVLPSLNPVQEWLHGTWQKGGHH